jgi:hypothetical protein
MDCRFGDLRWMDSLCVNACDFAAMGGGSARTRGRARAR